MLFINPAPQAQTQWLVEEGSTTCRILGILSCNFWENKGEGDDFWFWHMGTKLFFEHFEMLDMFWSCFDKLFRSL